MLKGQGHICAFRQWPRLQKNTDIVLKDEATDSFIQEAQVGNNKPLESDATMNMEKQGQANCKECLRATINNNDHLSQLSTKQFQYRWLILCKSDYYHSSIFRWKVSQYFAQHVAHFDLLVSDFLGFVVMLMRFLRF